MSHEMSHVLTTKDVKTSSQRSERATIVACSDSRESFHAMIKKIATLIPAHNAGQFVR